MEAALARRQQRNASVADDRSSKGPPVALTQLNAHAAPGEKLPLQPRRESRAIE